MTDKITICPYCYIPSITGHQEGCRLDVKEEPRWIGRMCSSCGKRIAGRIVSEMTVIVSFTTADICECEE